MSKTPYKKCSNCGLYNDMTVEVCKCGADMTNIPALLVDGEIPSELCGEINEGLSYHVQKCPACGTLNFTIDPEKRVKRCYNCTKGRVAQVQPVPYVEEEKKAEEQSAKTVAKPIKVAEVIEEEEDDEDCGQWSGILGNIKQAVGGNKKISELTLTAVRYGQLSFTLKEDEVTHPYMLGRSANQSAFLEQDGRVSNEHCSLVYRDDAWYVKDNYSSNGTAVNRRDIGEGGEHKLNNGDELILGHESDSMAFRIGII